MAELEIVIGRSGTGKSDAICKQIEAHLQGEPMGSPIYWVVPDEIAYTTERTLMSHFETVLRVEVITMRRLAERMVGAVTSNVNMVNTTGKRLLLASVYRDSVMQLGPLRRDNPSVAFLDSILSAFDELSGQMVDIQQLEGAIEVAAASVRDAFKSADSSSGHSLLSKLRDLCLLYIRYRRALDEGMFLDPAVYFSAAAEVLDRFEPLKDAVVYFDGYTDMSLQMLQFAVQLAKRAKDAKWILSVDPIWLSDAGFKEWQNKDNDLGFNTGESRLQEFIRSFHEPNQIFMPKTLCLLQELIHVCEKYQVDTKLRCHTPNHNIAKNDDLAHIEQNIYGPLIVRQKSDCNSVRIATAQNARSEVTGIAQEMMRMTVKTGIPYDEIAVIVPNIDEYKGPLEDVFSKYDIPYNLDTFPPLTEYPLAKFLLAALSVVREGFSVLSVTRLIQTDFCGLSQEDADWFETYIKAYEISSPYDWQKDKPWTFMNDVSDKRNVERILEWDARAQSHRSTILQYMAPFYETMNQSSSSPRQVATAIWKLFVDVGAKEMIANWMVNEDGSQNPLEASLHEQAWQYLIALCDNLAKVSPDTRMATSDLVQILFADLESISLSTIPTALHHVLVTDFSRTHGWNAKVVFVAGLTDQAIPKRFVQTGLLQDEERLAFRRLFGVHLGYTSTDELLAQRDVIYHLVTRARQNLILSYPKSTVDGREGRPSIVISRIQSIFREGCLTETVWDDLNWIEKQDETLKDPIVITPKAALDVLVDSVRPLLEGQIHPMLRPIVQWFCEQTERQEVLAAALRGFVHHHDTRFLGRKLSEALYGNPLKVNVYQLEAFAACPYKHFVQYGLKVSALDLSVVSAVSKGTLMHDVLLSFVVKHMEDIHGWQVLSDEEAVLSIEEHYHEVMQSRKFSMWHKEALRMQQAREVLRSLRLAAVILTRHARFGSFTPHSVELSFGLDEPGSLPSFNVELEDGTVVSLRGRIDRVDVLTDADGCVFRVVDYKSSRLDIDLTKVEHGLRLQLPVYAAAIEQNSKGLFGQKATPAGILYFPILHKVELKNVPIDEQKALLDVQKHMRARGWMIEDMRIVEAMDKRLVEAQDSELFAKVYTKSQTVTKYSPTLPLDEWNMLISRATHNVKSLAQSILAGDVRVSPYRIGLTETACQNCPFQAVCQFDPNYDQHLYRKLDKVSRSDIREKWSSFAREDEL